MPFYKMQWILKRNPGIVYTGPVMGVTKVGIFLPLTKKQAESRLRYFKDFYKRGTHFLQELDNVTLSDIRELRKIPSHAFIQSIGELSIEKLNNCTHIDEEGNEYCEFDELD